MSNTLRMSIPMTGAVLAAPRQLWFAALGAAAVTRDWAEKEAGTMFRTLVKEGSVVESRALSVMGNRVETSMQRMNALANETRRGVKSSVRTVANVVQSKLPRVRASIDVHAARPARATSAVKPAQRKKTRATSTRRATKSRTQK